jgi:hypothetical protein
MALAHSLGLSPVLKIDFVDPKERGDVLANSKYAPHNPQAFFGDYKALLLQNARLAQQSGAGILLIGTELGGLITGEPRFRPYFVDMIDSVRKLYGGKLTLATQVSTHVDGYDSPNGPGCIDRKTGRNWCMSTDEASFVTFWDKLDYVGIDAYANLTSASHPTVDQLRAAWHHDKDGRDFLGKVEAIARKGGKPLLITEMGAASVDGAQECMGCWGTGTPVNNEIQARIYEASIDAICEDATAMNLAGILLWSVDAFPDTQAKQAPNGIDPTGFTFQGKPAEQFVRAAFRSPP